MMPDSRAVQRLVRQLDFWQEDSLDLRFPKGYRNEALRKASELRRQIEALNQGEGR